MRSPLALATLVAVSFTLAACDGVGPEAPPQPVALEVQTAADVAADPTTGRDPVTGQPTGTTNRFTFYSLRENRVVLRSTDTNRADSASTKWDLAFRGTTILVNGGVSGPGQGAVQVLTAAFGEVTEAPAEGYRQDATGQPAIPTGGGLGWYTYTAAINTITPTPGRVLVVRAADGTYAKVRILSYYRGNPAIGTTTPTADARYYTFEFVHQPDGTRGFATTAPQP